MRGSRQIWDPFSKRFRLLQSRPFCTKNQPDKPTAAAVTNNDGIDINNEEFNGDEASSSISRQEAYKQLQNLDFMTATKILFTTPPKRKKFGIDFHLVQLFFACMPSLAVYLVAQYARSEMRRMEAELEVKKKSEEEAKAKELELKAAEEQKETSDPQFLEVKERLDKLEEAVKEIVVESKKKSSNSRDNSQVDNGETKQPTLDTANNSGTNASHSTNQDSLGQETSQNRTSTTAVNGASQQDKKS